MSRPEPAVTSLKVPSGMLLEQAVGRSGLGPAVVEQVDIEPAVAVEIEERRRRSR